MSFFLTIGPAEDPNAGEKTRSTLDAAERVADERPVDRPEWNTTEVDGGGDLVGLTPRQVPGDYTPARQYTPAWLDKAAADFSTIIDGQVSTSGTAAAREAAGRFGHGTMPYTESLTPVIRNETTLGTATFIVGKPPIQHESSDNMQAGPDHGPNAVAGMLATTNAKNAWLATTRLTGL